MKKKKLLLRLVILSTFLIILGLAIYQVSQSKSSRKIQLKTANQIRGSQQPINLTENSSPSKKEEPCEKEEKKQPENNPEQNNSPKPNESPVNPPIKEETPPLPPKREEKPLPQEEPKKLNEEQENLPSPTPRAPAKEEPLAIVNGKVQVPRRWLYTTEMNDIVFSFISGKWHEETTQHGAYIHPSGSFIFGSIYDIKKWGKRDLNWWKTLKSNQFDEDPEICFIPVNVNAFHHSLLVYKKSDDTFRHFDSLGGCNFSTIQANTINNDNLIQVSCPQQSGDGWGSCGIYPPIITSILLKRYKSNGLVNPADWEISKEQFLAERNQIMDLI